MPPMQWTRLIRAILQNLPKPLAAEGKKLNDRMDDLESERAKLDERVERFLADDALPVGADDAESAIMLAEGDRLTRYRLLTEEIAIRDALAQWYARRSEAFRELAEKRDADHHKLREELVTSLVGLGFYPPTNPPTRSSCIPTCAGT